jgi:hypothetical protein
MLHNAEEVFGLEEQETRSRAKRQRDSSPSPMARKAASCAEAIGNLTNSVT